MHKTLEIEPGAVSTIWMNRPAVHNAFDAALIAELTAACRALDADVAVRIVVLAGRGKSFCAGADLNWMQQAGSASAEDNLADAQALAALLRSLAELGKPTIARVQGAAIGGGMGLACACDICVVSPDAVFAAAEVRLGLIPAAIGPYVLRAIGPRQGHRYFLTAEPIGAARAVELGLAHEMVAPERLDERVAELGAALLKGAPAAQAAAKTWLRAIAHQPVDDGLVADAARRLAELRVAPEAREGLAAFLEKRPAAWVPRD
jgi:methylglutaconyl-CoA hydratase